MDATQQTEIWRPIPGYEGHYEASSLGRIRSVKRATPHVLALQWNSRKGKWHVTLSMGGRVETRYVHTMVAAAFLGPRPEGMWACHNDDDSHDNRPGNLRWDTPASNVQDMVRAGNHHYGKRTHCKWGHAYTPENTVWRVDTSGRCVNVCRYRLCRECQRNRVRTHGP